MNAMTRGAIPASLILLVAATLTARVSAQTISDELARYIASKPHPTSPSEFQAIPHLSAQNQDTTFVCWSFATSSFLESEMERLGREAVRLSVMYSVYNGFVEKARRFVATKGTSRFSPDDLFSGVLEIVRQYGAMPAASYEGLKKPGTVYSHNALYAKLETMMKEVTANGEWDEKVFVDRVKAVLNVHLGAPPERFTFKGKEYTPASFAQEVVRLPWEDYLLVTSFSYAPFNTFVELRVPDNWMHRSNFFNVPLDLFYSSFRTAISSGYSVAVDADNSEPSYMRTKQFAIILPSDLPEDSIGQTAREVRFRDGRTTDDHLMHAVSFRKFGSEDWFLVKDSWRTAFEGPNGGYMFVHGSYVKMKILAFLVHRSAVPEISALIGTK